MRKKNRQLRWLSKSDTNELTKLRMRRYRARFVAEGLTTEGNTRVNKRHPELAGLGGKTREYHTLWTRKQRAADKAAWEDVKYE